MSALPKLNFPAIRLRARRREGQVEVWDDLRGIYLVLTPEEWVRRHLIAYLVSQDVYKRQVCDNDVQRYKAFNQNPNFNIIFYKKNLIEVLWLLFLQAFIIFE